MQLLHDIEKIKKKNDVKHQNVEKLKKKNACAVAAVWRVRYIF